MLTMSQVNHIKDLSNCGYRISEISKETGTDPKTIRKYLSQEDFSSAPPVTVEKPSILDPFKLSSGSGSRTTRNTGASSTIPPKGFMSGWWKNRGIQAAIALCSAI